MKRFMLKTLNYVGYMATSYGAGYLFGRLFSLLFKRIWTEEVLKTKPVLFYGTVILYYTLLTVFAFAWITIIPVKKVFDLIESKIDDYADEKDWD